MAENREDLIRELYKYSCFIGEKLYQVIYKYPSTFENMSLSQLKVLHCLDMSEDIKMKDIGERLCITPSSATNLVNKLINGGYVERYNVPEDRREIRIRLAEKGRLVLKEMSDKNCEFWAHMVEKFDEEEREQALQITKKFYRLLNELL